MAELVKNINTFTHDALIGGTEIPLLTKAVTLLRGIGNLVRGTVIGKVTIGAATAAAKSGGNTGNGTITMDATTPILAGAKVGVYTVRFTAATTFTISDPDGFALGTGATGAAFANDLKFTIAAGGTAFVAGDGFDITVAAGSGYYKIVNSANVDGSAVPEYILTQAVAVPAGAEISAEVYTQGIFNGDKLTFGGTDTAATHAAALRARNIFLTSEQ